jgi:S-adenosylmethionine-dependent methyltransferase
VDKDLANYLENTKKPWGELFYRVLWSQLPKVTHAKVLDFGSGFGITANHLAENNDVVAIEPNPEMLEMRMTENCYKQLLGDIRILKKQNDNSFDLVLCHNVLEYTQNRHEIIKELYRVLKPNGIMSLVKHNHEGRIMQKVVFENNVDEALQLLNGGDISVENFGKVNYYNSNDVSDWISDLDIDIEKILGIRTFWALQQNNEIKHGQSWQEKMFQIEVKVSTIEKFINISFFNHLMLKKFS